MSLINEALKKAQRARTGGSPFDQSPASGGGPIPKRGKSRSVNTVVLLGSGAVVLVVLSVVITVYLFQRPDPAPPSSAPAVRPPASATPAATAPAAPVEVRPVLPPPAASVTAAPVVVAPPADPPAAKTPIAPAAAPATPRPAPPPVTPPTDRPSAGPEVLPPAGPISAPLAVSSTPPPSASKTAHAPGNRITAPPPAAAPEPLVRPPATAFPTAQPNERIAAYVESIRISGLRSLGNDSRVLINDRVYRVNEIVERTLGVRLVKVEPNALTFVDANGVQYVKYF